MGVIHRKREMGRILFDLKGLAWLIANGDTRKMRRMLRDVGTDLDDREQYVPRAAVRDLAIKLVREGDQDGPVLAFILSSGGDAATGDLWAILD
jgi:hypothetical protein